MRFRGTYHRFRALAMLSALALAPFSVYVHAIYHGHAVGAHCVSDAAHAHEHAPVSSHQHASGACDSVESIAQFAASHQLAGECEVCDLFSARAWLLSDSTTQAGATHEHVLALRQSESQPAVDRALHRSRAPPA